MLKTLCVFRELRVLRLKMVFCELRIHIAKTKGYFLYQKLNSPQTQIVDFLNYQLTIGSAEAVKIRYCLLESSLT
jgi:hypothetical protein